MKLLNEMKLIGKEIVNYRGFGLVISNIVLLIVAAIFLRDKFYTFTNFTNVLSNNSIYAILSVGMMFVLLTGGIDVSIGSILAVSAVTCTKLMTMGPASIHPIVWVLLSFVIGALLGGLNGLLIGKLKVVPLIATLGTLYIYRGLAFLISNGEWYMVSQESSYNNISNSLVFGKIPSIVFFALAVIIIAGVFLALYKPGRRLYAVGTSEKSSLIVGINVGNVKLSAYLLCGALAGLCGVLFASQYSMAHSEIANGYEMTAIAICVIGGVANTGGKGRMDCLVLGILFMSILTNILNSISGFSIWSDAFQGAIILVAVLINIVNEMVKVRHDVLEMGKRL